MKLPVDLLQKAEREFGKDFAAIADIQTDIAKKDVLLWARWTGTFSNDAGP